METDVLLKENDTAICEHGTLEHFQNIHENETVMGTGACAMCNCKKYDEVDALLTKCRCGDKKKQHLSE